MVIPTGAILTYQRQVRVDSPACQQHQERQRGDSRSLSAPPSHVIPLLHGVEELGANLTMPVGQGPPAGGEAALLICAARRPHHPIQRHKL